MRQARSMTIGEAFAGAMKAYEDGKANEARRLARQMVEAKPGFGGAHYLLGLLALDRGDGRRAAEHLARAIAITPDQPALHLAMGRALEQSGSMNSAILHYRTVLARVPGHAEANARLGELLRRSGKSGEAIALCRRAVAANPADAAAHNSLGALLLETGQPGEAVPCLRRALDLRPDWPAALNNFGIALQRLGRLEEAAAVLAGVAELRPDHAGYRATLASVLRAAGQLDRARDEAERAVHTDSHCADGWIELGLARDGQGHREGAAAAFERAVALEPDSLRAHWCLAEACRHLGDRERAARHYRACLSLDPEDRHGAGLGLGLIGASAVPGKAPAAYVRQLFDDYAEHFDAALVGKLDYRAPALLADALGRALAPAMALTGLTVMDAGCGTGLTAPVLRPLAARLDGVDLSPAMVAKAAARGLYDGLAEGDLISVLSARGATYDLVVAADVLVYLGDLGPVMAATHAALRPGGAFAFTVERAGGEVESYALGGKHRYAHAAAYVRSAAEQAGFTVLLLEDAVTRLEAGAEVPGLLAVLRRA